MQYLISRNSSEQKTVESYALFDFTKFLQKEEKSEIFSFSRNLSEQNGCKLSIISKLKNYNLQFSGSSRRLEVEFPKI